MDEPPASLRPTPEAALPGQPDWAVAPNLEPPCPRCGYNLRGLTTARCPECGLEFEWPKVLAAAELRNSFLFEHNWRKRPVRSWLLTLIRGFRPRRFWEAVSIYERVFPWPLLFLYLTAPVLFLLSAHGTMWALGWLLEALFIPVVSYSPPRALPIQGLASMLRSLGTVPVTHLRYAVTWIPAWLTLFYAPLLLTLTLGETLARCRVRYVQLLRVAAYAAGPVAIFASALLLLTITSALAAEVGDWVLFLVLPAVPLLQAYLLGAGLKHYLHLRHARLVGLVAAFVGALAAVTLYMTILALRG